MRLIPKPAMIPFAGRRIAVGLRGSGGERRGAEGRNRVDSPSEEMPGLVRNCVLLVVALASFMSASVAVSRTYTSRVYILEIATHVPLSPLKCIRMYYTNCDSLTHQNALNYFWWPLYCTKNNFARGSTASTIPPFTQFVCF